MPGEASVTFQTWLCTNAEGNCLSKLLCCLWLTLHSLERLRAKTPACLCHPAQVLLSTAQQTAKAKVYMEVPLAIYLHHTWQQELEGEVVLSSCQDPCRKQE